MSKIIFILLFLLIFVVSNITFAKTDAITECHSKIKPLNKERDKVSQLDGIWGLFEKNRELQGNSIIAINLDRKINSVIFHLEYLCNTLDGIPMNEVARYVRDGIKQKGKIGFREELIKLGKPESEIDIWFKFTEFSIINKNRTLNLNSIINTINKVSPIIHSYALIADKIDGHLIDDTIIKSVKRISKVIDNFFISNKYMNQAFTENSNIPYVDINESSGGS